MGEVKIRSSADHFIEEWADIFDLSSDSPSGLVWKVPRGTNIKAGDHVGWLTELNYWKAEYKNKVVGVHRVVYFLHHGKIDRFKVIDHKDGDPKNNSIDNLREITYAENTRNKKISKNSKTGKNGVFEAHDWVATWSERGKAQSKKFSVLIYGEKAKEMAIAYREKQISRLNEDSYNYTERHGT